MKNKFWLIVFIAVIGIMSLSFAGCSSPGSDNAGGGDDGGGEKPLYTELKMNTWTDGLISASDGEEMFSFIASDAEPYIHIKFGSLTNLNIQLYDREEKEVGEEANINISGNAYVKQTSLTAGDEYIVKVTPFIPSDPTPPPPPPYNKGNYRITYNSSATPPALKLPDDASALTVNEWKDGNIAADGEQWYKFTATSTSQVIHVNFETLSALYAQVYDSTGGLLGTGQINNANSYNSISVTVGNNYYIRVVPYFSSGKYQITIGTSTTTPIITLPEDAAELPLNTWSDVSVTAPGGAKWFKFTATAATQYIYVNFGTLNALSAQLYTPKDKTGSVLTLNSSNTLTSLTVDQVYYIKVWPSTSSDTGAYQIAFSASATAPAITLPADVTALTADTAADGNITAPGGVQWFKFTASSGTQYINAGFGTLTGLSVQLYNSAGVAQGSGTTLNNNTKNSTRYLTSGQEYYIKVTPSVAANSGTYKIKVGTANTVILPAETATLTAGTFADGNIPTSDGEQWFKFTATAISQNIQVEFGTLTDLYVQVYNSDGTTNGSRVNLYSSTTSSNRTLAVNQVYYINVTPYSSSYSGTYKITFNTPTTTITPPTPDDIVLTADKWAYGYLSSSSEQWFRFTATAIATAGEGDDPGAPPIQYIHADFGNTTSSNPISSINVQLYTSDKTTTVGTQAQLNNTTKSTNQTVTTGNVYYIKVTPYSYNSGTYKITFSDNAATPASTMPSNAIALTPDNTWVDGNITASSSEQWFKFTATDNNQYIHVNFGTLDDLYVRLYNSDGNANGTQVNLYGSTKYANRSITSGTEYYIRVWPYSGSGTYQIAFNTSTTPPLPPPVALPSDVITLTANTWVDGNIATSSGEQWYKFTATATPQYIYSDPDSVTVYVTLYDSSGATVRSQQSLAGGNNFNQTVTIDQVYYIKVTQYSSYTGAYRIGFTDKAATPPPVTLPAKATTLSSNIWTDGNITATSKEQWYKFTATATAATNNQYIHADFGTVNTSGGIYVQLYDSDGVSVGNKTQLNSTKNTSRTLTGGNVYYIKVTPYNSTGICTYKIGFTKSTTAPVKMPEITALTADTWASGNIPANWTSGATSMLDEGKWFKFTAAASTAAAINQYVHARFDTLVDLNVQLYDTNFEPVGNTVNLTSKSIDPDGLQYATLTLKPDQEYYIRITPYKTRSGNFSIALSSSTAAPK
jgi:hypothetical protein